MGFATWSGEELTKASKGASDMGRHSPNRRSFIQRHIQNSAQIWSSVNAYACLAYLRTSCDVLSRCTLISPLKPLSVHRLELQAALISSRLVDTIAKAPTMPNNISLIPMDGFFNGLSLAEIGDPTVLLVRCFPSW